MSACRAKHVPGPPYALNYPIDFDFSGRPPCTAGDACPTRGVFSGGGRRRLNQS